jgi:hypothetical protein
LIERLEGILAAHVGVDSHRDEHRQQDPARHGEPQAEGKAQCILPVHVDSAHPGALAVFHDASQCGPRSRPVEPQVQEDRHDDASGERDQFGIGKNRPVVSPEFGAEDLLDRLFQDNADGKGRQEGGEFRAFEQSLDTAVIEDKPEKHPEQEREGDGDDGNCPQGGEHPEGYERPHHDELSVAHVDDSQHPEDEA